MCPKLAFGILFNNDTRSDSFFFDPTSCLNKVDTYVQKVQLMSGLPYFVRLQLKGFPNEFVDTSEDKDDGVNSSHVNKTLPVHLPACASELETSSTEDSKRYEGRPTVCKIDELHLEIVDESDNLVTGAMGKGIAFVTVPL